MDLPLASVQEGPGVKQDGVGAAVEAVHQPFLNHGQGHRIVELTDRGHRERPRDVQGPDRSEADADLTKVRRRIDVLLALTVSVLLGKEIPGLHRLLSAAVVSLDENGFKRFEFGAPLHDARLPAAKPPEADSVT